MGGGCRTLSVLPAALGAAFAFTLTATTLRADDVLQVGATQLDRPTVVALGVQLLITGDDNQNASVAVRYRAVGTTAWQQAMPLFRVRPEVVTGRTVAAQFAGSIFDLVPNQSYEIELRAVDADGSVDQVLNLTGTTRAVPSEPKTPNRKSVTDVTSLRAADRAGRGREPCPFTLRFQCRQASGQSLRRQAGSAR